MSGVYDDAYQMALKLQAEHGYTFVHPFDDPKVIAGQGTIGLEILEDMPDVDAVIVPIGGGGLISGVALALKTLRPDVKVYGVQSSGAPSMVTSLQERKIQHLNSVSTIADGIAVKEPGINTFDLCNQYVDEVVTVSDDEIAAAILALLEQKNLLPKAPEPSPLPPPCLTKSPSKTRKLCALFRAETSTSPYLAASSRAGLTKVDATTLSSLN